MTDFKWYLNRQGVRGAKGDKGEKGFSPVITEKENTKKSYVLHIQNETDDTSFDTPNLKEGLVPEDLGGDYVKLNRDTGKQYYGNIDEGTNTIKGIVRFATDIEASNGEEVTAAVTPDQVAANYTTKVATDKLSTDLTALTTQEQNDVIALGKRITTNETNISSMKADINSIASDSASLKNSNKFTGTNTFIGKVNIAGAPLEVDGVATLNQVAAKYLNAVNITSSGEINAVSIKANGLRSDDIQTIENKKYLTELDVDNQTIQVVNGKLHANLDELGNEVNDLSGRVTVNEADISTMKTSLGMKQTKLTAGANITLTDLSDGTVKIDAAGGGGGGGTGDVTAAGDNIFTGSNTFDKTIKLGNQQGINLGTYFAKIIDIQYARQHTFPAGNEGDYISNNLEFDASGGGDIILCPSDITIQDGMTGSNVTLKGKVCDLNRKAYIKQDTVEAGDNITVTQTELGVKISATTPTITVIDGGDSSAN